MMVSIPTYHISGFTGSFSVGPSRAWLLLTVTLNDHMIAHKWKRQITNELPTSMYASDSMTSLAYCSICDHSVWLLPSNML